MRESLLVLDAGAEPGPLAMARDAAAASRLKAGEGPRRLLRLHGWSRPCLTLGRAQAAPEGLPELAASAGVEVSRRPTGGGWLLHLPGDLSITYVDAGPLGAGEFRATARFVSRLIARLLEGAGRQAIVVTGMRLERERAEVCFERADRDEVLVGREKAAGVALARLGRSALVQTALPLVPAGGVLAHFAERFDQRRAASQAALAGLRSEQLSAALAGALGAERALPGGEILEDPGAGHFAWPEAWEREARGLLETRFGRQDYTFERGVPARRAGGEGS